MISEKLTPTDTKIILNALGIDANGKAWQTIKSPLREENDASFGLNVETGAWKDHATGETGDVITLIERINHLETKQAVDWLKKHVDLGDTLHKATANGKVKKIEPFWNEYRKEFIKMGMKRIDKEPGHRLLTIAKEYDCLELATLQKFGCGIVEKWGADYLALPYATGCQLYRREGEKIIKSVKGSTPGASFFGIKQLAGRDTLYIAKSPRETMLLNQLFSESADVVGLCTGEQGNISKKQFEALRNEISASKYSHIYIFLDCDTEAALKTALSFESEVRKVTGNGNISVVNIHEVTGFKDITDCVRGGMDKNSFSALLEDTVKDQNLNVDNKRPLELEEFYSCAPENKCIYTPTRDLWYNSSVDARIPPIPTGNYYQNGKMIYESASDYLAKHRSVEQMTWAPGYPMLIRDRFISNGGIVEYPGCTTFNLYQPPNIKAGDPEKALNFLNHIKKIYPNDFEHLLKWFAQRVQYPGTKINHAIVLGGSQGIGKDTTLEPLRRAVGSWNFHDVTPNQLIGDFNGFLKSIVLRISEAREMGDVDRYGFYEHLKIVTTAPPEVLRINEKNRREYGIMNVCGVVITTNHKAGGIYLPADDRRHYVAWSDCSKDDFKESYWRDLWEWYDNGGFEHVTAYLQTLDISNFDPKEPPPKTAAFWEIVDAGRAPEDAEMADALDKLNNPDAVTIDQVASVASVDFKDWLQERRNRRQIPHRFDTAGYVPVRNDAAKDGLFKIRGKRSVVYAKKDLSKRDRIEATNELITAENS